MYSQPTLFKKILEFLTWSSLILLVPLAALGFLSESALPGNVLYPVKRGIEAIVLGFESFDKNSQALYSVYLADKRFSETEKLLTANTIQLNTSDTNDLLDQINQARETINQISDTNERLQLRKQLLQNITEYRNQLSLIQNQSPQVQPTLSPSPIMTSVPTGAVTLQITPTQSPQISLPSQNQNSNGQISNLDQQLQQLQNQIQLDQNTNTYQQNISGSPTPTSAPTGEITPTNIPTNKPTMTLVPTEYLSPFIQYNQQIPSPTLMSTPIVTPTPTSIPPTSTPTSIPTQENGNGFSSQFMLTNPSTTPTIVPQASPTTIPTQ